MSEEKKLPGKQIEKQQTEKQLIVAKLGNEEYGIEITQVQEIIKVPQDITRIPDMPEFIEGMINLRGKIVPIIDLRKRFNLKQKEISEETRIVVASIESQLSGFVVDSVNEVLRVSSDIIEPVPSPVASIGIEYLNGIAKLGNRLIILLNLEKILSDIEKSSLKEMSTTVEVNLKKTVTEYEKVSVEEIKQVENSDDI